MTEKLGQTPANTFFTRLKQLCEEGSYTPYLIDFSLNESIFFIANESNYEYLLLCVAFGNQREQRYVSYETMLTATGHSTSPLKKLLEKKKKLNLLCDKNGMSGAKIYLALATEFSCLTPEEERQAWRVDKGINLIVENVEIAQETGKEAKDYNKYAILADYLSAKK